MNTEKIFLGGVIPDENSAIVYMGTRKEQPFNSEFSDMIYEQLNKIED